MPPRVRSITSADVIAYHAISAANTSAVRKRKCRTGGLGQPGFSHEVQIHRARGFASFGNRPHDERLAAPHISGGEYSGDRAHPILAHGNIATRVELDA